MQNSTQQSDAADHHITQHHLAEAFFLKKEVGVIHCAPSRKLITERKLVACFTTYILFFIKKYIYNCLSKLRRAVDHCHFIEETKQEKNDTIIAIFRINRYALALLVSPSSSK